jgi:urease accessory protein
MRALWLALTIALLPGAALAHSGHAVTGGFLAGLAHPILGWDHVAAMVAVGLWGASLGRPALWVLPLVFPLAMAAGGVLGVLGVPLPGVEAGIAASALILGLMVALTARPPLRVAALLVGAFAVFHGHAHGTELPEGAGAAVYALGFVLATALLHLAGIALGLLLATPLGRTAVRGAGGGVGLAGLGFLSGAL